MDVDTILLLNPRKLFKSFIHDILILLAFGIVALRKMSKIALFNLFFSLDFGCYFTLTKIKILATF